MTVPTVLDALDIVGDPSRATCPSCRYSGPHVERPGYLPVSHGDRCAALAAERLLAVDDYARADLTGVTAFERPADHVEADLLAALGITLDVDALVHVAVEGDTRRRVFAVEGEHVVVLA